MGEMAEWARYQELLMVGRRELRMAELCRAGLWQKNDGTVIAIADMTSRHIQNSVEMIKRKGGVRHFHRYIRLFEEELARRAEEELARRARDES